MSFPNPVHVQCVVDLQCTPEVEVRELDWTANAEGFLATMGPVDCILATGAHLYTHTVAQMKYYVDHIQMWCTIFR